MKFIEVIHLLGAISTILLCVFFLIYFAIKTHEKRKKARLINKDLLCKIVREVESCAKRHNINVPINDKIEIITDAYDYFIKDYYDYTVGGFHRVLDIFVGSRVVCIGAEL